MDLKWINGSSIGFQKVSNSFSMVVSIIFEGNEDERPTNLHGNGSTKSRTTEYHEEKTNETPVNPNIEEKVTGSYPLNDHIFKV